MNACIEEYSERIHDYLDGDLAPKDEKILLEHLKECDACRNYYAELNEGMKVIFNAESLEAPDHFTYNVMQALPSGTVKINRFSKWIRKYPSIIAAALFLLLMGTAITTYMSEPNELIYTKNSKLKVENNTVIVPKNVTINEDVIVENGDLIIEGKVNGSVTVINGKEYLASIGEVTGDIEEVNEFFNWLWYKIKSVF